MPNSLISALGVIRLKSYLESLSRYAAVQALLVCALTTLLVLAAGFGVTALTIWLASQLGAAVAFAMVAAGFVVLALVLEVAVVVRKRRREATRTPLFSGEGTNQATLGSIAALAVIGYFLGRRAERR